MLPGSVRRVAAAAPHTPILSSIGSAVPRPAVANISLACRPLQQRRYSSSKPSRDNDSGDLPVNQSVQQSVSKAAGAKSSGEKRKRKAKESSDEQQLPRVPSTQSIPNECMRNSTTDRSIYPVLHANICDTALALSSFFSLHRPISVTHSLPRIVSDAVFAKIFTQKAKGPAKPSEVMSTIEHTVRVLDDPMAGSAVERVVNGTGPDYEDGIHKDDMMRGDQHHGGLAEAAVSHQINAMSGAFLPFRPPPMPSAPGTQHKGNADQAYADAALAAEIREQRKQEKRVYRAVFTIEESLDSHGEVKILAHSPELIEEPQQGQEVAAAGTAAEPEPRTFLGRMALRQMRYEAISVKRQRKLKMKKKKYKKLQKRLRHERRKLDR